MQPADILEIPRRTPDVEDYIDIARRHAGWIAGPAFLGLVVAVIGAYLWPNSYVSDAAVRSVPPALPTSFVEPILNVDVNARLSSMAQQILKRETLAYLIEKHRLYPDERAGMPISDVVEVMRRDVNINVPSVKNNRSGTTVIYRVSFKYEDRRLAQAVVADMVSRLLTDNEKERESESRQNKEFLGGESVVAKQRLDEVEQKLAAFRARNAAAMPEQSSLVLGQLTSLQQQVGSMNARLASLNNERLIIDTELRTVRQQRGLIREPQPQQLEEARSNEKLAEADRQVEHANQMIAAARQRMNDSHPDMQAALAQRDRLVRQRDELRKGDGPGSISRTVPVPRAVQDAYQREVAAKDGEIARLDVLLRTKENEEQELRRQIADAESSKRSLDGRLSVMPASQEEYMQLNRERDIALGNFQRALSLSGRSEIAAKVVESGRSEQLELHESASLPTTPVSPNRPVVIGAGVGVGIMAGIALAWLREARDSSLKNLKDVRAYTQLAILGCVPLLENDLLMRRRRRLSWVAWSTAVLVGVVAMSATVAYYYMKVLV